jgi:hypothetical protein
MSKFQPPPAGLHRAVISGVETDTASKSGHYKMVKLRFSILTMGCAGSTVQAYYCVAPLTGEAKPFPVQQGRKNLQAVFDAAKRPVGQPATLSGAIVSVLVNHKPNDMGGHWAVIDSVMPDDQPTTPASVPPMPAFSDDGMPF